SPDRDVEVDPGRRRVHQRKVIEAEPSKLMTTGFRKMKAGVKTFRTVLLAAGATLLTFHGVVQAQVTSSGSSDSLTLDKAINIALHNNRIVKIAELSVNKAEEDISVAKTLRLPSLHAYTLVSGNLAKNERRIANPDSNLFPGVGPFFLLPDQRGPTATFAATAIQPLTQQYRIGLNIKMEKLARDL